MSRDQLTRRTSWSEEYDMGPSKERLEVKSGAN